MDDNKGYDDDEEILDETTKKILKEKPFLEVAMILSKQRFDRESDWPRLPGTIDTCEDYESFTRCAFRTSLLVDFVYNAAVRKIAPFPTVEEATSLSSVMNNVADEFADFWFMHSNDMTDESRLTKGDLPLLG